MGNWTVYLQALVIALLTSAIGSASYNGSGSAVGGRDWSEPVEWLLVTLDGVCLQEHTDVSSIHAGLLAFTRPGPRVTWAYCGPAGRQLLANISLTARQSLHLTHFLDRMQAHNRSVWLGGERFSVCCYQRRPARLAERAGGRRDQVRPALLETAVYAGVGGLCALLLTVSLLLMAVLALAKRRRGAAQLGSRPRTEVSYSERYVRRMEGRREPEGGASGAAALEERSQTESELGSEEDVLLDMLSQPPAPRDHQTAVANRNSRDFY